MVTLKSPDAKLYAIYPKWEKDIELEDFFRCRAPSYIVPISAQLDKSFGIYSGETLVGMVQIPRLDEVNRSADISMLVDKTLCTNITRHEASEGAYQEICDYLFLKVGMHKLYIKIRPNREKLKDRFEKGGWSLEGLLRESTNIQGKFEDEFLMGILQKEYVQWRNTLPTRRS